MKKYTINYNFGQVSNEKEAYILGYLYADGYVLGKPYNRIGMMLAIKDFHIIEEIGKYISPLYKIKTDIEKCWFHICGKEMINNLSNLGLVERKSQKEFKIPNIPKDLIRHFIRGYFDGDGCVGLDRNYLYFYICSPTITILEEIQKELLLNNISCSIKKELRKGKRSNLPKGGSTISNFDQYRLYIRDRISLEKVYNYLYKESAMKLKRKYELFDSWLQNSVVKKRRKLIPMSEAIKTNEFI